MQELKSTLRVVNEADLEESVSKVGVEVKGMRTRRILAGNDECPSERLRVHVNTFNGGVQEHLHWHLVEALYYVISGRAVMEDIEGRNHEIGPGSAIYYPPGIAGAHSWNIKEEMKLLSIRATTDPAKLVQFSIDKSSMESSIKLDNLIRTMGGKFKSFY
jgi:mannose-6-phosphate isomerase-like protein (cupin superfamily)